MDKQGYWIWFSNLKLRNRMKQKMLRMFKIPENIWQAQEKDLLEIQGIQAKEIMEIRNNKNRPALESQQEYMYLNQIGIVTMQDKAYPPLLQQLYDKPICLYYKGDVTLLSQFSLAIIGCREHTPYGATVASQIAQALGKRNITTVSGLARGIDSIAHRGSLQAKRKNNCSNRKRIETYVSERKHSLGRRNHTKRRLYGYRIWTRRKTRKNALPSTKQNH